MPDPQTLDLALLEVRFTALQQQYQELIVEAQSDGIIMPDEQALLDAVAGKLAEIERRLAESSNGMFGGIMDAVSDFGEDVMEAAGDLVDGVTRAGEQAFETGGNIVDTVTDAGASVVDKAGELAEYIVDAGGEAIELIGGMETDCPLDVSDAAMTALVQQVEEQATLMWEAAERRDALIDAGGSKAEFAAIQAEITGFANAMYAAEDDLHARTEKRGLLDALSYGPLSVDRATLMDHADVNALIEAYGRSPDVATEAMRNAVNAEDPSAVAQNVGTVLDLSESGFAGPDGEPLPTYEGQYDALATIMLRNGAAMGQEYFDGAQDYYASGAHTAADPCTENRNATGEVNNLRTAMMGRAMLDEDGNIDMGSESAKDAMDHMLYHPGVTHGRGLFPECDGPDARRL